MKIATQSFFFSRLIWIIIDLIYPPTCCNCGKVGFRLCLDCFSQIQIINKNVCKYCGEILIKPGICKKCKKQKPKYKVLRSWGVFQGPLREMIHTLKYQRNLGMGDYFAPILSQALETHGWQIDIVIPVPLNKERLRERGYNQAEVLAKPLAVFINKSHKPKSISRIRNTQSQVGLSLKQRRQNVKGAFMADASSFKGKQVLIIDDVATTGSTLDACTDALLKAGAESVFGLTLARAIKVTNDQF